MENAEEENHCRKPGDEEKTIPHSNKKCPLTSIITDGDDRKESPRAELNVTMESSYSNSPEISLMSFDESSSTDNNQFDEHFIKSTTTEDTKSDSYSHLLRQEELQSDPVAITRESGRPAREHDTLQLQQVIEGKKIVESLHALKQEKEYMASDITSFQEDMSTWLSNIQRSTQESISTLMRIYQRDGQEKRELLSEMTSMNEELNRRGETISSLKEVVSMYEKKVIELNSEQDCSLNTIKQLSDELTDRTQRLHDLSTQQDTNKYN